MIWVLTSEPYHDNSCVLGAYTDLHIAEEAFKSAMKTTKDNDLKLTSCDGTTGEPIASINYYVDSSLIGYYRYHPHRFIEVDPLRFDWSKDPE